MKISKYFAFGAMALGSLAMAACGGGGGSDDTDGPPIIVDPVDAPPGGGGDADVDAPPQGVVCNPNVQSGCDSGEKCDWVVPAEGQAYTDCVPNGTVPIGMPCTYDEATGVSDCVSGGVCLGGVCETICTTSPDSCGAEASCLRVGFQSGQTLFEDVGMNFGTCNPNCDPVALDCAAVGAPDTAACYAFDLLAGTGVCLGIPMMPKSQDDECTFVNDCRKGESCGVLFDPEASSQDNIVPVCSFMCTPEGQTLPDGTTTIGCDFLAPNQPPMSNERTNGPGANYECRFLSGFYSNTQDVPPHVGMCVDTAVWGTCADLDPTDPASRGCAETFPQGMGKLPQSVPVKATPQVFEALRAGGYIK